MIGEDGVQADSLEVSLAWLKQFQQRLQRPLRVLHVGNIANNAYLNAKILRTVGIEADVLCHNYYHIMSCPEWEEVPIRNGFGHDSNHPRFSKKDLQGYKRPAWFMQGPIELCARYFKCRQQRSWRRFFWWQLMAIVAQDRQSYKIFILLLRGCRAFKNGRYLQLLQQSPIMVPIWQLMSLIAKKRIFRKILLFTLRISKNQQYLQPLKRMSLTTFLWQEVKTKRAQLRNGWHLFRQKSYVLHKFFFDFILGYYKNSTFCKLIKQYCKPKNVKLFYDAECIIEEFNRLFPDRRGRLTVSNIIHYRHLFGADKLPALFDYYDIIQAYSIDPILCLLFSKKPYLAFEHGTLRVFTQEDIPLHHLNALAYRKANHVFITNGDCLEYAYKIGVDHFSPMIHPIDVEQHRRQRKETKSDFKTRYAADVLLFCPLRHDWEIKGTHLHLLALPLICQALTGQAVKLVLTCWGLELERSRNLIKQLNCEANVVWTQALCREDLVAFMQAADVVLDQMALPCFGGTAPQAIAAGTPVIMSYKPESTQWILNAPAPIIPAFTPQEICAGVLQALDQDWLQAYKKRAQAWTDSEHSTNRVIRTHLEVYRKVLEVDGSSSSNRV